jgi:signal transduction histidine kinase
VNQKFLDTLHLKREDVIGKTSLGMKLIDETTREKLSHILDSDKGISNIEMKIVIGDSNYYGLFSADTIFIQDKKCLLTVMQDITEIKRIQQELSDSETRLKLALEDLIRLNDQLKEINSSKDKLLEIMAHDLRNPLITIMNSAELLTDNILNNEPENSGFLLQDIFAQAKNTLSLLDNLLTWAKSQTGKLIYNPRNLQLLPIVKQVFSLFHLAALKKNISLIFDESDDLEIFADLNMIETILRNLISNAVKFTHSGGMVTIHAGMLQNNIEITVSDNGIGMKEEIANKLFRTDTNYSSPGTDNERGSGLGLILCHDFVKKHKGNIWIESEPGKGSRFIFTLPLKKET